MRLLKRGYGVGNHRTRKKTWMITAGPDRVGSSKSESRTWPAPDGRRGEDGDDDVGEEERAGRRPQRAEAVSPGSLGIRSRGIRSKINQSRRRPAVTTPKSKSPFLHRSLSLSPRAARRELAGVWPRGDLARWVRGVGCGCRRPSGASAFWASVLPSVVPIAGHDRRRKDTHTNDQNSKVEKDIFFSEEFEDQILVTL